MRSYSKRRTTSSTIINGNANEMQLAKLEVASELSALRSGATVQPHPMTRRPQSDLTPEDERLTEIAAQNHLQQELAPKQAGTCRVLPSAVSDFVDGLAPDADGAIAAALRAQLPLRRLYRHLLEQRRAAAEIEQAAAAGAAGATVELVLDHATLQLREVAPGAGRHVLRLRLNEDVPAPPAARPVLHLEWDDGVARVLFPELVDGVAQFLLDAADPRLARILADARRRHAATRYRVVL